MNTRIAQNMQQLTKNRINNCKYVEKLTVFIFKIYISPVCALLQAKQYSKINLNEQKSVDMKPADGP